MTLVDLDGTLASPGRAGSDPGFFTGPGVYETLLAERGRVFRAAEHLARMRRSAASLRLGTLPDDTVVLARIHSVLEANRLLESSVRVNLRLDAQHLLIRASGVDDDLAGRRHDGITAITVQLDPDARAHPDHKLLARRALADALAEARSRGADEALLVTRDGQLLEGSTSNLFAVIDGTLTTPPLDGRILPGVTRAELLRVAVASGIPTAQRSLSSGEFGLASEALLSSAIRVVAPLVQVDDSVIGSGRPGRLTTRLRDALLGAGG